MIGATANAAPEVHPKMEVNPEMEARPETDARSASDARPVTHAAHELDAYTTAKELAESYTDLLKQKESYRGKMGYYPHYTLDDAYYLLTQGAHAQAERVQTSALSDPTARAVEKAEKLMNRLNREMDAEYQAEVVEPFLDVCEKVALFETCMKLLDAEQRHVAYQLYVQQRPRNSIVDLYGNSIPRVRLEQKIDAMLKKFAYVLSEYSKFGEPDRKRLLVKSTGGLNPYGEEESF